MRPAALCPIRDCSLHFSRPWVCSISTLSAKSSRELECSTSLVTRCSRDVMAQMVNTVYYIVGSVIHSRFKICQLSGERSSTTASKLVKLWSHPLKDSRAKCQV
jgi:hypothetical protein